MSTRRSPETSVQLLGPPYRRLTHVDPEDPRQPCEGGWIMTWHLGSPRWKEGASLAKHRRAGVSLAIVLPDGQDRGSVVRVLRAIEQSRPHAVLPYHEELAAREVAAVVKQEPSCLATSVADYLEWRGFDLDPTTRSIIRRTIHLSTQVHTIEALARNLYMSRRALGRRLVGSSLPVPSRWLHIARVLRATIKLQNSSSSLFSVAVSLGYSDGFSLSNQMHRLCGIRPLDARERLGWEWVFETWLAREAAAGSITARVVSRRPSIASAAADAQLGRAGLAAG